MGIFPRVAVLFSASVAFLLFAGESYALPSLARDSKVSCFSCHNKTSAQYSSKGSFMGSGSGSDLQITSPDSSIRAGIHVLGDQLNYGSNLKAVSLQLAKSPYSSSQPVAGLSGYLGSELFQASVGWVNIKAMELLPDESLEGKDELWYRFALTPSAGGIDFTFGLFGSGGKKVDHKIDGVNLRIGRGIDDISLPLRTNSMGIDAGVSGKVGGVSLNLQTMYVSGSGLDINNGRSDETADFSPAAGAFSAKAQVGLGSGFGLTAAYSTYRPAQQQALGEEPMNEKSATIGAWLTIKDKIKIQPEYTIYGPDREWLDKGSGEFYLRLFTGF